MPYRLSGTDISNPDHYSYNGEPCETCGDTGNDPDNTEHYCSQCWAGEFLVAVAESEEHQQRLTAASTYSFSGMDCWNIVQSIADCEVDKLLLWGPPGTGKTTFAMNAALNGRQAFPVTMTEDKPAESLIGHPIPVGDRWIWMDGAGSASWRASGRLVLNELDHAQGDALDIAMVYCDDPAVAELTLPNQDLEVIRPGERSQVWATMNGQPRSLPSALLDRFPACIHIAEVRDAAIQRLPEDLRAIARVTSSIEEQARRVSIRKWLMFAQLRERLGEHVAAYACFGRSGSEVLAQIDCTQ